MEKQTILYIYSFPSYLREQPRVKIGRTSGSSTAEPVELALQRIRAQVKTSHPEAIQLLGAVKIPGDWVEQSIHAQLKEQGYHIAEAPGNEWFKFPNQEELQSFIGKLHLAFIVDDFSEFGGGRRDVQGDSFDSIISAFGVKKLNGTAFRREVELIRIIDQELSFLYPGFQQWLAKTISDPRTVFNVAYRNGKAVGVAIWKLKGNGIAKLSTLFVTTDYRSSGIGRNLILTCFEQWKTEKIRRAFVTTAKVELIPFFERYGFWGEGLGREIYERAGHEPEWFLTKLLFHESDKSSQDALNKAKILFPPIIKSSYKPSGRQEVEKIKKTLIQNGVSKEKDDSKAKDLVVQLEGSDNSLIDERPVHSWFNLTYPADSIYTPQTAYVIPIRPQFLIQIFQAGKTVYYGKCSCVQEDMRGALVMFYASSPVSGVVAIARIVARYMGTPAQLHNKLGMKGVLSLEEIGIMEHKKQAVEFDHLMPLQKVVRLNDLRSDDILKGPPQTMHSLSLERYKKAVELGGLYAG